MLYESGFLFWGSIVLGAIAITALLLSKRIPTIEPFMWLSIVGILFGWYSELRAKPINNLPDGITLQEVNIRILYPLSGSAESQIRYKSEVQTPDGQWLTIRLQSPEMIIDSYGSEAIATLDLSALRTLKSEGYRNYLISEGFVAQGNVHKLYSLRPMNHPPISSRLQSFRQQLIHRFDEEARVSIDQQSRGLIYALSLGDRSLLPRELKTQFASAGVAHILAVSGYHLGIVYGLVSLLIGKFLWRYRHRRYRYILILLSLVLYTLMTGASTATVRALLMSTIALGAKLLDRPSDPVQLLSLVLLVFLCINPFAYYSIGLLLSVSAVWGIYTFLPLFQRWFNPSRKWLKWFADIISISLSAQIGVFPILLMSFGTASLGFLWSNIPIVFISGVLIPLALLSFFILQIFGQLPAILLQLLNYLAISMEGVTNLFTTENYGINLHARFDLIALILYYAIAYLASRLLHGYICRMEENKLIHREIESGALL